MSNLLTPNDPPQFGTAEYAGQPGIDRCKFCHQTVMGSYFRMNGSMACSACAEKVRLQIPKDSHAAFTRGLVFGVGGAILGLILYAAFGIITGIMIGYVSLAVGYIVGKAIKMGSGGIGGRRYQIAGVVLTYAAVSIAAIPIYIAHDLKVHRGAPAEQSQTMPGSSKQSSTNTTGAPEQSRPAANNFANFVAGLVMLALLGLASPFAELADPLHGVVGLIILFVGIQIAWKLTAGVSVQILGPFRLAAPSSSPSKAA